MVLAVILGFTIQAQQYVESDCFDGIDNNEDGFIDCDDADCAFACGLDFYVPNAFTPDGDNLNDVFYPVTATDLISYEFRVFNRRGQEIFYSETVKEGWSGNANGGSYFVSSGVYHYAVTYSFTQGDVKVFTGSVTLIR